jgi:hypothetical protein
MGNLDSADGALYRPSRKLSYALFGAELSISSLPVRLRGEHSDKEDAMKYMELFHDDAERRLLERRLAELDTATGPARQ